MYFVDSVAEFGIVSGALELDPPEKSHSTEATQLVQLLLNNWPVPEFDEQAGPECFICAALARLDVFNLLVPRCCHQTVDCQ